MNESDNVPPPFLNPAPDLEDAAEVEDEDDDATPTVESINREKERWSLAGAIARYYEELGLIQKTDPFTLEFGHDFDADIKAAQEHQAEKSSAESTSEAAGENTFGPDSGQAAPSESVAVTSASLGEGPDAVGDGACGSGGEGPAGDFGAGDIGGDFGAGFGGNFGSGSSGQ